MNSKEKFFSAPVRQFKTAAGTIDLPIFYYDYAFAHFLFWADHDRAAARLEGTAFTPCRFFNGKAGVLLNFFQYRKSAIGPYNEVGLSILSHPRNLKKAGPFVTQLLKKAQNWTMGAYVINLPVTTEIANAGGREVWSYPKFVTDIRFDLNGRQFAGIVGNPEGGDPICSLEGQIGFFGPWAKMWKASFISFTTHRGTGLRILTEVDARYSMNLGFSGRLKVSEAGGNIMAKNLIDIGLKNKKPFVVLHCESARMVLHEGAAV